MPEVVLIRVPPGWTAQTEGYYLNAEALSNLTAAAKTYRLERDEWERAFGKLSDEADIYKSTIEAQLAGLKNQLNRERDAWSRDIRRARSPGFGIFAGVGVVPGGVEAVAGVGVVWKVF